MKYRGTLALVSVVSAVGWAAACGSSSDHTFDGASDDAGGDIPATTSFVDASSSAPPPGAQVIIDGVGQDAPSKFGGAESPDLKPNLFYPNDMTVLPPNMGGIEFHWQTSGSGAKPTVFELHATGPTANLYVYFGCTSAGFGCSYSASKQVWEALAAASNGGTNDVAWIIRASDGTHVGTSDKRSLGFSAEDLVGGLYYWNAGAGTTLRYEFGVSNAGAEVFMSAPQAGAGQCVGCHVLSRSGKKIALGMDIPAPAAYKVFDVATRTAYFGEGLGTTGSNFFAFSPDETQILTSDGSSIALRSAADGAPIAAPLINQAAMPDWSPDGKTIVYARPSKAVTCVGGLCAATGVDNASLETYVNDGSGDGGAWSQGKTLVTSSGGNNYYPSFSVDGAWVIFNRSPSNANSYDASDAEVWVTSSAADKPAIQLVRSRAGGDSWPKWAPVVTTYKGKPLLWFTFSSRRPYGVKSTGNNPQIWMAALDPGAAASGVDPSFGAFWLPAQDITTGNHIPQWVAHVERKTCTGNDCAAGETCQGGVCVGGVH